MPGKKILIVDDEPNIVEVISLRRKALDYQVDSATDGEEAIAKAKTLKPDLIIMDVLMPKLTGFEALKKIRQDKDLATIPAIVISAKGSMKDFFIGFSNVKFITKPYDPKKLVDSIESLLGVANEQRSRSKSVILMGVEDGLVNKVRDCLKKLSYQVFMALNEEEALTLASTVRPSFIFCQYWEDLSVLDPKKIAEHLAKSATLSQLPCYCFCKSGPLALDAMKTFKGDRLIGYTDSADLLNKVEEQFKVPA